MEHTELKVAHFHKLVLLGIALLVVLLITLIIVLSLGLNSSTIPTHENTIYEPVVSPKPHEEQIVIADINDNISLGTQFGEMWVSGSQKALGFLTDFDDVVKISEFFRTGYREFYDAVRADSGEEFIEITVERIAKKNDIAVLGIEINGDNSVKVKITGHDEASTEGFRRDIEELSFVSEASYVNDNSDSDGMFVYDIIMVISH